MSDNPEVVYIRPKQSYVEGIWFDPDQVGENKPAIPVKNTERIQRAIEDGAAELVKTERTADSQLLHPDDARTYFGSDKDLVRYYDSSSGELIFSDPNTGSVVAKFPSDGGTPHFPDLSSGSHKVNGTEIIPQNTEPTDASEDALWVDQSGHGSSTVREKGPRGWRDISEAPTPEGPSGNWKLVVQDEFKGDSLNTDLWGINGGETKDPLNDDADADDSLVDVSNGTCTLQVTSDGSGTGGCYQGPISTYPGDQSYHANVGYKAGNQGVYIETRAKLAGPRNGLLPAFWMNPVGSGSWPPEIDIYELFQTSSDPDDTVTDQSAHGTTTGQAGDDSNSFGVGFSHDHGEAVTDEMHVYGAAWYPDRVEFYIDGEFVGAHDLIDIMRTMNDSDRNDLYVKFTTHVNRVGNADLQSSWTEESEIDYVRIWELEDTPADAPVAPSFERIDNVDGGTFASGWQDPDSAWTTTTSLSSSGSASATNSANNSRLGWEGSPNFRPGKPGTKLETTFAFDDSTTSDRLNIGFGTSATGSGPLYRLDILDEDLYVFETGDWNSLHHDNGFSMGSDMSFHTATIEFTDYNFRYEVKDPSGNILSQHAFYDVNGYDGSVCTYNAEEGTVYIDEVRIARR